MSKGEIALELTLEALEKSWLNVTDLSSSGAGKAISELYNAVFDGIKEV